MTLRSLNIELCLTVDDEDVRGTACDGTGPPRSFHGWLGLIGALDALVAESDEEPAPRADAQPM